ncbi:UBP14, partial [Symbiodinium microadriaticum]
MVEAGEPQIFPLSDQTIPEFVRNICQGVIDHQGMRANMQRDVWEADTDVFESKYAADLPQLSNGKTISNHPAAWRCEKSGDSSNLWLNLSTGYIGGGRKNWDGSGGSGAALEHYIETGRQYPLCLCCVIGTITPHGADVWSYADDEDSLVKVPRLAEYLSHWGIDIMRLEKTDKTLAEQEVDINKSYDWSKVLGNGVDLQIFKRRYFDQADQIRHSLPTPDASMDLPCQMSKLATALLGDRYVTPSPAARAVVSAEESAPPELQLEKFTVAPRMFKHIVGRGHRDFSSGRQQDASEYFQFLLDQIDRTERTALGRMGAPHDALSTPSVFKFELEERYQCSVTGQVRYMCGSQTAQNVLELRIPLNRAVNREEVAAHQLERKRKLTECSGKADDTNISASCDEDPKLVVPFAACLESHFAEDTVEYRNPSLGPDSPMTPAMKSIRFGNFPRYLMIKLGRYYVDTDWTMKKIDAEVPVPERIDLSQLRARGGLQPNEVPMATPEEGSGDSAGTAEMFAELPDEGIVAAADWLFSRADDIDVAVAEVESGAVAEAGGVGTASSISAQLVAQNDGAGVYSLQGIVSHVGRNTEHGHYVCHIKKGEGKWIFFNDDKVSGR